MTTAVKVEGLGKRFLLGQTFENTLSGRVGDLLRGRGLRKSRAQEEFWALRNVDFEIAQGEAVGIIGGNGAGKSTLLKVLSRITPPTEGRASVRGRLSSLLEVGTGFHPELTGRENVFLNGAILGMRKAEVERKFDEIVAFAGVEKFIDTPVKRYSSGMYVRLAFAVAAHLEPDVLIIDEVLAVGDADFQKRCLGKMNDVAREGRTVLFVSHNMAAVQNLCQRALLLRSGGLVAAGEAGAVIREYLDSDSSEHASSDFEGGADGKPNEGYLYRSQQVAGEHEAIPSYVRVLGDDGRPLDRVETWDSVTFEICVDSSMRYRNLAVALSIQTPEQVRVLHTSTQPDHLLEFKVEPGRQCVRCRFEQLPLAAGTYQVGLTLAIPNIEVVWRRANLFQLQVAPRDVFDSGRPPTVARTLVAVPHAWQAGDGDCSG